MAEGENIMDQIEKTPDYKILAKIDSNGAKDKIHLKRLFVF